MAGGAGGWWVKVMGWVKRSDPKGGSINMFVGKTLAWLIRCSDKSG